MHLSDRACWRTHLFAIVMLMLSFISAQATETRLFDVKAGPAAITLKRFAQQARLSMVFDPQSVRDVVTQPVVGELRPNQALSLMLQNTPLFFNQDVETGAFAVTRAETKGEGDPTSASHRPGSNPAASTPSATPPPRTQTMKKSFATKLTAFFAVLTATAASAQTNPAPGTATPPTNETIVLSPFVVDASRDTGYLAGQTLSGTRLKSDLKDIGSSMTVFTEQLMNDLGANSIYDLMAFAPNTDPFVMSTNDVTGNGNDFINIATKFVSRGGATSVVGQDFFTNNIPNDRFNSEALTFTRGPNAILFGLGNAAGAFVSSTKRAKTTRTATTVEYQIDDRGSYRGSLDHNQVIKKNLFAIRYSGVYEALNSFRIPTESFQRRHFLTATFTPFKRTTLRFNYEKGLINAPAVRPWPDYDAVSPWIDAGRPLIDTFNAAAVKNSPLTNYTLNNLVSTISSAGGKPIPTQRLTGQGQTVPTSYANGYPVNGANFRSLVRPDLFPTAASNFGNSAFRITDYKIASLFLEQQITKDFFIEAAYNRVNNRLTAVNGFVGQLAYIYADPNRQLPNGEPNPNVGLLYSESQSTYIDTPNRASNQRVLASYNLDFTRRESWGRHLGRHQIAVFTEQAENYSFSSNNGLFNSTPLPGFPTAINNPNNAIRFRYYFEPDKGKIGTNVGNYILNLPVQYANQPLPTPDPSGITPAFFSFQGPTMSSATIKTKALASQSFFMKDRLVVTYGLRKDDQASWAAVPNDLAPLRDANGTYPDPRGLKVRELKSESRTDRGGNTYSRGLVYHVTPWMSLSYNTSTNFQVNATGRNVYGNLLPNPEGAGTDYGMKFSLLDQKVFLELTYYTSRSQNNGDAIASNPAGNFKQFDQVWIAINGFTRDPKYLAFPYSSVSTTWQDVVSTTAKGYEFSLTANPTKQWRITLNGSKRGDNATSDRGVYINQYMAEYVPIIESHPEWLNLNDTGTPVLNPGPNTITVGSRLAELKTTLVNFNAIRSSPSANFASNWTLNLVQSYEFAKGTSLQGFTVGGSMNARGPAYNGFGSNLVNGAHVLDPTIPYYAPAYATFGGLVSYKRKLFNNRVNWRVQLNVRNLLNQHTLYPLINVDTRDGNHTPDTAVYTLREPRTYQFTSSFSF